MFKNQKNIHLKISLLGHAYSDIYIFIIPLLLPFFRQEFDFSYFQSGLILTIHVALRSLFSLVFGYLGDRFNHKNLFISFGFILSSILLGSFIVISNLPFLITILFIMAIGVSTFHPLATAMVGEKAEPEKRGHDLCLFNAAGTLGVGLMSLLFGWIVQIWGWRMACLFISLPGVLVAWAYTQLGNEKHESQIKTEKLNHQIVYIIYFISRGLRGLGQCAILSFLPVYITDHFGLNPGVSVWFVSLYFAGELSGSLWMSKVLDRKNPLKIAIFATLSIAILIASVTYIHMTVLLGLIIAGIGMMQGFYYPSQHSWITKISTDQTRGKLFGIVFFIEGASATVAPFLYGWIADQYNLVYAYRFASLPIFVSFLLYILVYFMVEKSLAARIKIIPLRP